MKDRAQILELIAHSAREVLPDLQSHGFTESDCLADLGANSVDRAEIVMLVQEALNLTIPRVELFGPANIGELAELFAKRLNGL